MYNYLSYMILQSFPRVRCWARWYRQPLELEDWPRVESGGTPTPRI